MFPCKCLDSVLPVKPVQTGTEKLSNKNYSLKFYQYEAL